MLKPPFALYRPLAQDPSHQSLMRSHDLVQVHTMCGSLAGTDQYFRVVNGYGYTGTESHFGTGAVAGQITQWTPLERTADASLDGNYRAISIENADSGTGYPAWSGSNVPPFTNGQVDNLVRLIAWLCSRAAHAGCPISWKCHQEGIPAVPVGAHPGTRGITWHRRGVESSPPFMDGYRQSGDEHWSTSTGKVCPGDKRIDQLLHAIIPRVQDVLRGGSGWQGELDSRWPAFGTDDASEHDQWGIAGNTVYGNLLTKASLAVRGQWPQFVDVPIDWEWGPHASQARINFAANHPNVQGREEMWDYLATVPGKPPVAFPGPDAFVVGKRSLGSFIWQNLLILNDDPAVRTYMKALGREAKHEWTPEAVAATKAFQLAHDALKDDADGIPGPMGWGIAYTGARVTVKGPTSLKAGPYDYSIEWADEQQWAEGPGRANWTGVSAHAAHRIVIRLHDPEDGTDNSEGSLRETLLHECVHVAFHVAGLDQFLPDEEEPIVHRLSTPLLSILRDNPAVVAYLTA